MCCGIVVGPVIASTIGRYFTQMLLQKMGLRYRLIEAMVALLMDLKLYILSICLNNVL